jgi:hypothetical protein
MDSIVAASVTVPVETTVRKASTCRNVIFMFKSSLARVTAAGVSCRNGIH